MQDMFVPSLIEIGKMFHFKRHTFHNLFRISNFFGLSTTEET
jgi:hypothetical protein